MALLPPPLERNRRGGERLGNSGIAGAQAQIEKYVSGYKNENWSL
jgi:hypothetical protein